MSGYWRPGSKAVDYSVRNDSSVTVTGENNEAIPVNTSLSSLSTGATKVLPMEKYARKILYELENSEVLIVTGETGCGKTTVLPQVLIDGGWAGTEENPFIIACTQPRRMSVLSVSTYVSQCRQPRAGAGATTGTGTGAGTGTGKQKDSDVGYCVRWDRRINRRTRLAYFTDALLLQEVLRDPLLSSYSVVIVDEVHERSAVSDTLLTLLRKILQCRPADFRVIVMSAQADVPFLHSHFRATTFHQCAEDVTSRVPPRACGISHIHVGEAPHDIDIMYLQHPCKHLEQTAVDVLFSIHANEPSGDILVFLPSRASIALCAKIIDQKRDITQATAILDDGLIVLQLHPSMPRREQMLVFQSSQSLFSTGGGVDGGSGGGRRAHSILPRKVILATDIAESGVTIDGVRFVIDSGLCEQQFFDPRIEVTRTVTCLASRASARQRAGRAGRTQAGKVFRLYTREFFESQPKGDVPSRQGVAERNNMMPEYTIPEIQRRDLTWIILQLKMLGIDNIPSFGFPDPPSTRSLVYSLELLVSLQALDAETGQLLELGRRMAEMPVNPQMTRALIASMSEGCSEDMLSIAAMCSVEHPFTKSWRGNSSYGSTREDAKRLYQENLANFASFHGDHLTLLNIYKAFTASGCDTPKWCTDHSLNYGVLHKARQLRSQLRQVLLRYAKMDHLDIETNTPSNKKRSRSPDSQQTSHEKNLNYLEKSKFVASRTSENENAGDSSISLRKCLVQGYFAHAAQLKPNGHYFTLRGDVQVLPDPSSVCGRFTEPPEWIIFQEIVSCDEVVTVREVSSIHPRWLAQLAPHYYDLHEIGS